VIARLFGLLLFLVAAWPAVAHVRAEGVVQAAQGAATHRIAKWGSVPGRRSGSPNTYDESERDTRAFGYADADDPETDAGPVASDRPPAHRVAERLLRGLVDAPPRHRACAAPPRGPPAA
jgi:hypothetical protein